MLIAVVIISLVIGFVVGAGAIGTQAARLGRQRRQPVWRLPEAAAFVSDALSYEAASELTPSQLDDLLRRHINLLQFSDPTASDDAPPAGDDEPPAASGAFAWEPEPLLRRLYLDARAEGLELTRPVLAEVVSAHTQFLTAIGALAPTPSDDQPGQTSRTASDLGASGD